MSTVPRKRTRGNKNKNKKKQKEMAMQEGSKKRKSIEDDEESSKNRDKHVKLYGIDLSHFDATYLFIILSICHIACSVVFAFFQEKVNLIEGYNYPKFMTVVQTITYTICAWLELTASKGELGNISSPRAPLFTYFVLSLLTVGGMYFTNWGLKFLSYPTRIIFKAAKPVPTMVLEWCYVGRLFTKLEITSVGILTTGIVLFCLGEARDAPSFHGYGVILMLLGVTFDALTSNYEKKNIFSHKASHCEAMFFASLMGSLWSILTLFFTEADVMFEAIAFVITTPSALMWLFLSSIGGYLSVTFILLLIKLYSTTYAECVKGTRKVVSILMSYLFLGGNKAFSELHFFGMLCFVVSIGTTVYHKYSKSSKPKKSPKVKNVKYQAVKQSEEETAASSGNSSDDFEMIDSKDVMSPVAKNNSKRRRS